jgi:hypothetical protein
VIIQDGHVIGSGSNRTNETRNATRHAEMEAIDMVLNEWHKTSETTTDPSLGPLTTHVDVVKRFGNCDLFVTCEPCIMCAAALCLLGEFIKGLPNLLFVSRNSPGLLAVHFSFFSFVMMLVHGTYVAPTRVMLGVFCSSA